MQQFFLNPPVQPEENSLDSLFAELILDKILQNVKKERLLKEIDQALLMKNKADFLRLSKELKELTS
ncbi:IDEAL domain-containing protein [Pseudoneobacillus sp. C159]